MQELKEFQAETKPHGHQIATDMNRKGSLPLQTQQQMDMDGWVEGNNGKEAAAEEKSSL